MANQLVIKNTTVNVGDTVRVHQKVSEGEKSRTQIFEGIIIAIQGSTSGTSFTVRRVGVAGVGIEKIIPVNTPDLVKVEIKSKGHVRRAKLYYLRNRVGKAATRVAEKKTVAQAA